MNDHRQQQEIPDIHFWGDTPEEEYFKLNGVKGSKSYYKSPRGINLFTRSWLPIPDPPRGLICMVHGYSNDISWTFQSTAVFLAKNGFACFAIDIEGHGRSDGLRAYVPSVDLVVQDCVSFFNKIKEDPRFQDLPRFLFGESLGGAICLLIHLTDPSGYSGAVLVAPMCKISDKVRPNWLIERILITIESFLPTLAIVPTDNLLHKTIKVEEKRPVAERNPMRYRGKPRLGTMMELLRVTDYLTKKLSNVSVPFIVLHGSADAVTDPDVSRALFQEAKSTDKTIRIYDGMLHSLLFGEPDDNIEIVRSDILSWLNHRCR